MDCSTVYTDGGLSTPQSVNYFIFWLLMFLIGIFLKSTESK